MPEPWALPDSPAAKVENKLQAGDKIVAVNGESVEDFIAYRAALAKNLGQPVNITFMRPETGESLPIEVEGNFLRRYGLEMQMGPVVAVRPDSPAAIAGLKKGDVIQKVDGADIGDPLTLPQRLRKKGGKSITLQVLREGNDVDDAKQLTFELTPVPVPWGSDIMGTMEIPSLGIAYKIDETIAGVKKGSAADEADFLPGDRVIAIDLKPANETQAAKDRALFPDNKIVAQKIGGRDGVSWVLWLRSVAQSIQEDTGIEVTVLRDGKSPKIEVSPATVSNTAILPRGFAFVSETDIMRANNLGEAMAFGWRETKYSMLAVYRFLHKLVSGQVSPRLLGGPGTIATVAGISAKQGVASLLLFLTMLSANLAVINFLPIPVLDGGHMVFLILEGIFRRPVSEKIVIPLTWAGLLLILALMLFVIGLDVNRFIL